ncbi:helix-turn-helix transcriptional regulator [Pedobacter duraquae]|uniref:HTH domain-containing protein n=1 Tax=Pedobacter duraquae TaxID=425511 RepID=A0A4R6IC06_9SPHI|nr:YafY family protein [Pedobacter duraquae]TDO19087.1 HTH domain-containing protein [Pedobacter duraquae]
MNRIDRLLGILILLQSRKYVSAEKIADHYQISIRTVYRDIRSLTEQGVPLSFEPNKGYFIIQGYFLAPVSFTNSEANALLLMERLVSGFADQSIQTQYTSALNKVKSVLKGTQKTSLEQLDEQIKIQLPPCVSNEFEHLSVLQQAISAKLIINIGYTDLKQDVSSRAIEPIGLIFYAFGWHLIAWCHKRSAYRDFKISRINSINVTEEPFHIDTHIPLGSYMTQLPVNF